MLTRSSLSQGSPSPGVIRGTVDQFSLTLVLAGLAVLLLVVRDLGAGWKLCAAAGGGYVLFKLVAILGPQRREFSALTRRARVFYSLLWPGFDARPFAAAAVERPPIRRLVEGTLRMTVGGLALVVAALNQERWGDAAAWVGIGAILLFVHLGYSDLLTWLARRRGYPVKPLFDRPWKSKSLAEFWSRRWNVAFVEMDRILFLPLLRTWLDRRVSSFSVFLISGLLHEMAISYPAGSGFGLPMVYFAIHAVAVYAERAVLKVRVWPAAAARTWTLAVVLLPLPLLFHEGFRATLVLPLLRAIGRALT